MPSYCSYLLIKKKERKRITKNVLISAKIQTCIVLVCLHMIKKEAQCNSGQWGRQREGKHRTEHGTAGWHQEDKLRWGNEIEKSRLHKRTNRRENAEGSQRVEAKDNRKEMSGKLKTKDMKGNKYHRWGGKSKRQKQKIDIYRKPFLLETASYQAQTRNTSKKESPIKHGKFRSPETSEGRWKKLP